jgi:hypothetical protein
MSKKTQLQVAKVFLAHWNNCDNISIALPRVDEFLKNLQVIFSSMRSDDSDEHSSPSPQRKLLFPDTIDVAMLAASSITSATVSTELIGKPGLGVTIGVLVYWVTASICDLTRKYASRFDRILTATLVTLISILASFLCFYDS